MSDKELGEIGARAAFSTGNGVNWLMCVHDGMPKTNLGYSAWRGDEPARTAFAAAVRKQVEKEQKQGSHYWMPMSELKFMQDERARLADQNDSQDLTIHQLNEVIASRDEEIARLTAELASLQCSYEGERHCSGERMAQILELKREVERVAAELSGQKEQSAKALGMALDLNLDLQNKADMWRDEFQRIKACAHIDGADRHSEIKAICDRAMTDIRSKISLVDMREKIADENADLRSQLATVTAERDRLAAQNDSQDHDIFNYNNALAEKDEEIFRLTSKLERAKFVNWWERENPDEDYTIGEMAAAWSAWQARADKETTSHSTK